MMPILILAAGQSSRMRGRDKLLEPVAGAPLLRVLTERALTLGQPVFVALPEADHPRVAALMGLDVTILTLPGSAEGMGGTLRDGVAALPVCEKFMIQLGDLPDVTAAHMRMIYDASETDAGHLIWRGATDSSEPGHPMIFDASLRPDFASLTGDDGGRTLVGRYRDKTRLITLPGRTARRDLDTPEDWAAWRAEQD